MVALKIVTHSGNFHADEVFACATLSLVFQDEQIEIIRSRDTEVISSADIVVDVGEIYDPTIRRFDHHQTIGAGARANGIPYASLGLVWKEFGTVLTGSKEVADHIDEDLIAPIDAGDNGYEIVELKTNVSPYKISSMVGAFNASWTEDPMINETNFFKMVDWAKEILQREVLHTVDLFKAKSLAENAYEVAHDKRLIILDGAYPAEEILQHYPEPLYVVGLRQDGKWGVKCIRSSTHVFANRKNLPSAWGGLRGKQLQEITGVPDAVFCHKALFLAAAASKDGAMALAKLALDA